MVENVRKRLSCTASTAGPAEAEGLYPGTASTKDKTSSSSSKPFCTVRRLYCLVAYYSGSHYYLRSFPDLTPGEHRRET
eukprot:1796666-Rhodomonas_salina.1